MKVRNQKSEASVSEQAPMDVPAGGSGSNDTNTYRECLRNHAASLGSYATDGCGEFIQFPPPENESLRCAACGCHRNFHRKIVTGGSDPITNHPPSTFTRSYSFVDSPPESDHWTGKKRFRTKFTAEQKEKMLGFAEKIGWRMQKGKEEEIILFCREIGVSRQVFKVWMHNHKTSSSPNASSLTQ